MQTVTRKSIWHLNAREEKTISKYCIYNNKWMTHLMQKCTNIYVVIYICGCNSEHMFILKMQMYWFCICFWTMVCARENFKEMFNNVSIQWLKVWCLYELASFTYRWRCDIGKSIVQGGRILWFSDDTDSFITQTHSVI